MYIIFYSSYYFCNILSVHMTELRDITELRVQRNDHLASLVNTQYSLVMDMSSKCWDFWFEFSWSLQYEFEFWAHLPPLCRFPLPPLLLFDFFYCSWLIFVSIEFLFTKIMFKWIAEGKFTMHLALVVSDYIYDNFVSYFSYANYVVK